MHVELIAIVHRDVQRAIVPGDGRHLTQASREAHAIFLRLPELVLVELPDAAVLLEDGAGILSGRLGLPVLGLTGVRRRADIDVQRAFSIEGDPLVAVLALSLQTADHDFGGARRLQLAGRHLITLNRIHFGDVQIAVPQPDAGAAAFAKGFFHVEMAVALGVAQRDNASAGSFRSSLKRDINIAIGSNRDMPRGAQAVGGDQRAKTRGQRDAAIVGIAGRRGCRRDRSATNNPSARLFKRFISNILP